MLILLPLMGLLLQSCRAHTADTPVSYVLEPFDRISDDWFVQSSSEALPLSLMSEPEALFGASSVRLRYRRNSTSASSAAFGWIEPKTPYNCHGAKYLSLWYRPVRFSDRFQLSVLIDDPACVPTENLTCTEQESLQEHIVFDQRIQRNNRWQEARVPLWLLNKDDDVDLSRIRGWKIRLVLPKIPDFDQGNDPQITLSVDHLACIGNGEMLASAFFQTNSDFGTALQDGSWSEEYHKSNRSESLSKIALNKDGFLQMDYAVDQTEASGGYISFSHLTPGDSYYNLSQATHVSLAYQVSQVASIVERAIVRFVLHDDSNCEMDCNQDPTNNEWYYSFQPILDATTTQSNSQQSIIPLEGSQDPSSPFRLTGWSGILGNKVLDKSRINGFTLQISLDTTLDIGTLVTGSVALGNLVALKTVPRTNAEVSYVMEPFEEVDDSWFRRPGGNPILLNLSNISTSDAAFGKHALRVDFTVGPYDELSGVSDSVEFGSIQALTPYNCYQADYLSLWYQTPSLESLSGQEKLELILFDDTECAISQNQTCSDPNSLQEFIVFNQKLGVQEDWQEIRVPLFLGAIPSGQDSLNLRRLRGWKIRISTQRDMPGDNVTSSVLLLDHLSCIGGSSLFGSSFYLGSEFSLADSIKDDIWKTEFYRSDLSKNQTSLSLRNGMFDLNYTIQQVEDWGGYVGFSHLAPGPAYYNVSKANHLAMDYRVKIAASIPGRSMFRMILKDGSHCESSCDSDINAHERYYSFQPILDTVTAEDDHGLIAIPLEGSDDPSSPFYLPGWSGILGNSRLDVDILKGFTLEFVLDSELDLGVLVSGSIELSNMKAVTMEMNAGTGDAGEGSPDEEGARCVVEQDLYFSENAPQFNRLEFLSRECCEVCTDDPECLFAHSDGRDCYVASSIDPEYVGMIRTRARQKAYKAYWVDDAAKRGDFCDLCDCQEEARLIDCRGKDLPIVPKTFQQTWTPRTLDLRENPRLFFLGSDSLSQVEEYLQELRLPYQMRHIAVESLSKIKKLSSIVFEEMAGDEEMLDMLNNVISAELGAFGDVCCDKGVQIELSTPSKGLTFCEMQVSVPGIDVVYEPFIQYRDPTVYGTIVASSEFMSEAAESPEKCGEYCSIKKECQYFSYDARIKNAEHICYLLETNGTGVNEVCCDPDHYADANQTIPGWTSGRPPQTRNVQDGATVRISSEELVADANNGFMVQYDLSLGSNPLRGAVWIEPMISTVSNELKVSISPSRVVLYDKNATAVVNVTVHNIGKVDRTIIVQNRIMACDIAFMSPFDNAVYIELMAPTESDGFATALAIIVPVLFATVIGLIAFLILEKRRRKNDSLWRVRKDELVFASPAPEIIGRGTFGLVLLAEYRGTQVAVKRVIPPCPIVSKKKTVKHASTVIDDSFKRDSDASSVEEISSSSPNATYVSIMRSHSPRGRVSMLSTVGSRANRSKASAWRKLKADFVDEMRILSKLRHPCITTVMGAVIEKNVEPMLLMEYMFHGSLGDILHNETMILEGELLLPILCDISQGVRFLHAADPQIIHGDLKAQNILVDARFRAKVADFGLSQKRQLGATGTPFWMAPELLRGESFNTAASDMYSIGIILYEVFTRRDPYEGENPDSVLRLVADKQVNKRPELPSSCPAKIQALMADCVDEDPSKRPTADEFDIRIKRVEADKVFSGSTGSGNQKTSISLYDIFPKHVADALREGKTVEAEHHECVTIFFSDIVGFTTISSTLPPRKIAAMLDRLYSKFDALSVKHDVFKVETIGDAWMGVSNLVKDQSNDHAKRIAQFAIDALKAANETFVDEEDHGQGVVNIRVGFHSGSVVADVVGSRNPRFCLFGDTVNTASRMESNSEKNRIHCSQPSAELLQNQYPELPVKSRGLIPIKGKGEMHTFWVNEGSNSSIRGSRVALMTDSEMSLLEWAKGASSMELGDAILEEAEREEAQPEQYDPESRRDNEEDNDENKYKNEEDQNLNNAETGQQTSTRTPPSAEILAIEKQLQDRNARLASPIKHHKVLEDV